jgi:hypothetical protein
MPAAKPPAAQPPAGQIDEKWLEEFIAQNPERVRKLLAVVIDISGGTQRALERRLGWGTGTISNVLTGRVELKLVHVVGITLAAGFHPGLFFAVAYPKEVPIGPVLSVEDFARRLERLGGLPPAVPEQPPAALPRTPAELKSFVEGIVRAALAGERKAKRKGVETRPKKPRRARVRTSK